MNRQFKIVKLVHWFKKSVISMLMGAIADSCQQYLQKVNRCSSKVVLSSTAGKTPMARRVVNTALLPMLFFAKDKLRLPVMGDQLDSEIPAMRLSKLLKLQKVRCEQMIQRLLSLKMNHHLMKIHFKLTNSVQS